MMLMPGDCIYVFVYTVIEEKNLCVTESTVYINMFISLMCVCV